MSEYKNESLKKIAQKFSNINLFEVDDIFVVPVGEICDKLGIKAEFKKLEDGHSGYFDNELKTIFINENYPGSRNLFTVAHEIGHFILHEGTQNRFDQYHKYTSDELKREWEANNFAGELLMPKYKFESIFRELQGDIKKIADWFGVSEKGYRGSWILLGSY